MAGAAVASSAAAVVLVVKQQQQQQQQQRPHTYVQSENELWPSWYVVDASALCAVMYASLSSHVWYDST